MDFYEEQEYTEEQIRYCWYCQKRIKVGQPYVVDSDGRFNCISDYKLQHPEEL